MNHSISASSCCGLQTIYECALEHLKQYVFLNRTKFPSDPQGFKDIYGSINHGTLVIISTKFEEVMRTGGYDAYKIIRLLKDNGLLDHEKDKTYRKRKIGSSITVKCYVITLPNQIADKELYPAEKWEQTLPSPEPIHEDDVEISFLEEIQGNHFKVKK